jgi:hypothetical protein
MARNTRPRQRECNLYHEGVGDEDVAALALDLGDGGHSGHVLLQLLQDGVRALGLLGVRLLVINQRLGEDVADNVLSAVALGATSEQLDGTVEGGLLDVLVVLEGVDDIGLDLVEHAVADGHHGGILQRVQRVELFHDGLAVVVHLAHVEQVSLGHGELVGEFAVLLEVLLEGEHLLVGLHGGVQLVQHGIVGALKLLGNLVGSLCEELVDGGAQVVVHSGAENHEANEDLGLGIQNNSLREGNRKKQHR